MAGRRPATTTCSSRWSTEDGEFRIAGPPDALIVPQSWYEQRFRQVSLYFFDPTAQVLVPEPVFVPRNADLASTLVQRLLAGPAPDLVGLLAQRAARRRRPRDLGPGVRRRGRRRWTSMGDVAMPGLARPRLLVAQLAWTLRQDPSVGA